MSSHASNDIKYFVYKRRKEGYPPYRSVRRWWLWRICNSIEEVKQVVNDRFYSVNNEFKVYKGNIFNA